jgi:peptidyl-prolyl cis-trans isomerase B (cyclophilin B)
MKHIYALLLSFALASPAFAQNPRVELKTSRGPIVLELYPDRAPRSVANFLEYAKSGFYDGTIFHRVIDGFMIQGGGFDRDMKQKPTRSPIENEAGNGLKNDVGTVAMARTSNPNSATAQFFINLKDNDFLNHRDNSVQGYGYTVFGKVVQGMDTVRSIARVPTGRSGPFEDVPREPVVIQSASVVGQKQEK